MPTPNPASSLEDAISAIKVLCDKSEKSQYFPYGGSGYKASVTHYYESSTEVAYGAVQPGSVKDLQSIVKCLVDFKGPDFALKCGGHSTNPGFSSTRGLQIHMARFNQIRVDAANRLVHVGAGCLFEELYQALDSYKLNIVGGSGLAGVGVAGWMLGGGYSAKTSQYGLGVDNLAAVNLVLPNGSYTEASDKINKNLFFAIKGGGNNFGIITEFTLKAHPQGDYEDFTLTYKDHFDDVKVAILGIIAKQDNKANVEISFRYNSEPGSDAPQVILMVHCVYDGTYSEDPFKALKDIHHSGKTSSKSDSFLFADLRRSYENGTYDLFSAPPEGFESGDPDADSPGAERPRPPMLGISQFPRGRWGNVMVDEFTRGIIDEVEKQLHEAANKMSQHGGTRVAIGFWPFTKAMFDHATDSAWPHVKGKPNCPIIVYFTWEGKANDAHWISTMKKTLKALRTKVHDERPLSRDLPYMVNTSFAEETTVQELYRENLSQLMALREKYDPRGLMDRTGGFKIPLQQRTETGEDV